ncbi:hypothetical protein HY968_03850 [Candidatus Kaiserbacteria bacterium]|nr:hypothetical protein [Candidatus Kaiserbacteria bacterium]
MRSYGVILFVLCVSLVPALSHAQTLDDSLTLRNIENAISITMSPLSPAAGDTVHLTAESPIFELAESMITWSIEEKTIAEGKGMTEASVTIDTKGTPIAITVSAVDQNWGIAQKSAVVSPPQIDILFDADTFVPPFYRGRVIPSAEAMLHLQALVRFMRGDGSLTPDSAIFYSWKRNGAPMGSVSGPGRSMITVPAPALFGTDTLSLDARSDDGTFSGTKSVSIPSREPIVVLYEDNPLFGILFHKAIPRTSGVAETRMTLAAIPYFATAKNADDPLLRYAWSVNGQSIGSSKTQPSELTVNADRGGVAEIGLSLSHANNLFLGALGQWSVEFSSSKAAADVFGTP